MSITLAIESSCDESALALFDSHRGILFEQVHTQMLHEAYGGVVPDLASREHLKYFKPLLESSFIQNPELWDSKNSCISANQIAVTYGPGLASCLAMGIAFAKALATIGNIPIIGVNHLRAHAYSPFIPLHREDPHSFRERFHALLPHLGLLASGGNTLLFEINEANIFTILAQTVDDAAGEALDKGAKLLGMSYPGGSHIEKKALDGNPHSFDFPRAFNHSKEMKFSFSGLKTSLRYQLEKMTEFEIQLHLHDLCASYQQAVIDQLIAKTQTALKQKAFSSLGLSGGVAHNQSLCHAMQVLAQKYGLTFNVADKKHRGDNAGMIAFASYIDPQALLDCDFDLEFQPNSTLL